MRTARRAYLYAVSFISLQAVLWATIGLGRLLLFSGIPRGLALLAPAIAGYLSVLIVGGPFYLIHWLIAQRLALRDSEERGAAFRSFFHYSLMTSTAIPGLLALQQAVHYVASDALGIAEPQPYLGYVQSLPVFLLQAAVMGVAWACAWRLAAGDAHALPESGLRGSLHRLYRYILATFGIALTASAAGMLLTLLLETGSEAISLRKGQLAIGLAQAVVGVPVWTLTWGILQRAFAVGGEETESTIRRVYQHLMCLVGSLGTIVACAGVLTMLLQSALRISQAPGPMLAQLARPLAVAFVGAVLWAYHAHILAREAAGESGSPAQRTYHYLTATLGLGSTLIGAIFLVDAIGPALSGMWSPGLRVSLCNGLATLAAGLPVWLVSWMRMQSLARKPDEHAEVERRAAVRRGYLYLVAFAGAIGLLAALASLISFLLSRVLGGDLDASFDGGSRALLAAFLFAALLGYHLHVIRADGRLERRSRAEVLAEFPIALVGPEPWTARFRATLSHSLPGIPIREHPSNDLPSALADTRAVLFPASLLATWPDAERSRLSSYQGLRLPVPENEPQWGWVGLVDRSQPWQAEQAARAIELAAFGEPVRSPRAMSPWAVAGGVVLLVVLIPIAIALIVALISLAGIR